MKAKFNLMYILRGKYCTFNYVLYFPANIKPLQIVWTQIRINIRSRLIRTQTVWHPDGISERFLKTLNLSEKIRGLQNLF